VSVLVCPIKQRGSSARFANQQERNTESRRNRPNRPRQRSGGTRGRTQGPQSALMRPIVPKALGLPSWPSPCPPVSWTGRVRHEWMEEETEGLAGRRTGPGFHGKSLRYIFTSGAIKAVGVPRQPVRPSVYPFALSCVCPFLRSLARSQSRSLLS